MTSTDAPPTPIGNGTGTPPVRKAICATTAGSDCPLRVSTTAWTLASLRMTCTSDTKKFAARAATADGVVPGSMMYKYSAADPTGLMP